ncbi:MAG: SDR family oxidoreductase [Flavobacteriaceae bacterium]|nr:SDR family oxidoreductase [Flavobacteriaceae bacterium]
MKKIIISGASRGIGFELVKYFTKNKHQVLALSRNIDTLSNLPKNVHVLKVDITKENDLKKVTDFIAKNWKTVDILINNAGKLIHKPFSKTTYRDFLDIYNVNVFAVATLIKVVLPSLKKGSHIVTISSMGGIQGSLKFAGLSAYSSSKGAVITLMELLAEEYKESGIIFNTLALGAVQTEMLAEAFPEYQAPITAKNMANYIANFALTGNLIYNGKVLQVSNSTP